MDKITTTLLYFRKKTQTKSPTPLPPLHEGT